jgi:sulfite reductase (NADPH) flavoprotein alpha-component
VNLAFSKDQEEEIFVHHKIGEHAEEFYDWVNKGASVFICGEKDPMSKEVEETILKIFEQYGKLSADEAKKQLEQLKEEGRYEKDVY